jgi:hypothetical protein
MVAGSLLSPAARQDNPPFQTNGAANAIIRDNSGNLIQFFGK